MTITILIVIRSNSNSNATKQTNDSNDAGSSWLRTNAVNTNGAAAK